jgi:AcrR family transcriptional regulator
VPAKLAIRPPARAKRSNRPAGHAEVAPTREVILDTAEQLFASRGFKGVAVRDIARQMQLTAPSLYNHFLSKQALYDAVLERGLHPIADLLAEAWHPGALRPDRMRATLDRLVTHLATHPHLARLLQRAILEESDSVHPLIGRWLGPVYRQGLAVIRETADEAGWDTAELPHLALGLFGMVFAYFTNTAALQPGPWPRNASFSRKPSIVCSDRSRRRGSPDTRRPGIYGAQSE